MKNLLPSAPAVIREAVIVLGGAIIAAAIIGQLPSLRDWIKAQWADTQKIQAPKTKSLNGYQPNRLTINNVKGYAVNTEHFIYSDFQFFQEGSQHHEATSILGRLDKRHRRRRAVTVAAADQSLDVMRLFAGFIPLAYNSGKERHPMNTTATKTIELPEELVAMLQAEAKRSRKTIAQYVAQWLEDQQDGREAMRRWKLIKSGKTKVSPAEEVYARLGI